MTVESFLAIWPVLLAMGAGAFWLGALEMRLRANDDKTDSIERQVDRHREKIGGMQVDQQRLITTLESIDARLNDLQKKLEKLS